MSLNPDCGLLSAESHEALRSLLGFSLRGRVCDPVLSLRPRGRFTSEGQYGVTWSSFIIDPVAGRLSSAVAHPSVWCRTVSIEVEGVVVTRLEASILPENDLPTLSASGQVAQHATGGIALFKLAHIEILARETAFPLADYYENAAPVLADRGIRFVGMSPAGNRCGFALAIPNNGTGLYFVKEDDEPVASIAENQQSLQWLTLRTTL